MAKLKKPASNNRKKVSPHGRAKPSASPDESASDENSTEDPESSAEGSPPPSKKNAPTDARRHQPPSKLEESSDEEDLVSDDEEEDEPDEPEKPSDRRKKKSQAAKFSPSTVKACVNNMKNTPSVRTFRNLAETFVALANQVAGDAIDDNDSSGTAHTLFNYMLKECLQEFAPKLRQVTRLDTVKIAEHAVEESTVKRRTRSARRTASDASTNQQVEFLRSSSPEWKKLRVKLRGYFLAMLQVLDAALTSSSQSNSKLQRMHQRQQQQVQRIIFRHVVALLPFYLASAKCTKLLMQTFIRFWAESDDEDVRLLVFVSIMRTVRHSIGSSTEIAAESDAVPVELFQMTIKRMYAAFLTASKDSTIESMPGIQFMQHSLVELLCLQPQAVYELAFTSIRQLASTLRNAMLAKSQHNGPNRKLHARRTADNRSKPSENTGKKRIRGDKSARDEKRDHPGTSGGGGGARDFQSAVKQVYSWPYVHAATLWCRLLSKQHSHPLLGQLTHPLVQTVQGAISLEASARNLPVRYHFVRALTILISGTHGILYVPLMSQVILTPLLAPWCQHLLSKSPSRIGYKPHNWRVMLKLSESQLKEDGARDCLIDAVHDACMEYLGATCHLLSFPECLQMPLAQLRMYLKSSTAQRCANLTQVMRLLKRKIEQNVEFLLEIRRQYFSGADIRKVTEQVLDVEKCLRLGTAIGAEKRVVVADGVEEKLEHRPPFASYFDTWKEKRRDELTKHHVDSAMQSKTSTGGKPRGQKKASRAMRTGEDAVPSYAGMAKVRAASAKNDFMSDLQAASDDDEFKPKSARKQQKINSRKGEQAVDEKNEDGQVNWADEFNDAAMNDDEFLTLKRQVAL